MAIDSSIPSSALSQLMASALKTLVKKEEVKKTGKDRGGQPIYALAGVDAGGS